MQCGAASVTMAWTEQGGWAACGVRREWVRVQMHGVKGESGTGWVRAAWAGEAGGRGELGAVCAGAWRKGCERWGDCEQWVQMGGGAAARSSSVLLEGRATRLKRACLGKKPIKLAQRRPPRGCRRGSALRLAAVGNDESSLGLTKAEGAFGQSTVGGAFGAKRGARPGHNSGWRGAEDGRARKARRGHKPRCMKASCSLNWGIKSCERWRRGMGGARAGQGGGGSSALPGIGGSSREPGAGRVCWEEQRGRGGGAA